MQVGVCTVLHETSLRPLLSANINNTLLLFLFSVSRDDGGDGGDEDGDAVPFTE